MPLVFNSGLTERDIRWANQCYNQLYEQAIQGFEMKGVAAPGLHGSLLVLGELLQSANTFMASRFREIFATVFRHKDSKTRILMEEVILLIPQLAVVAPDDFVELSLSPCMDHLLARTKSSHLSTRQKAFASMGSLTLVVGNHAAQYLDAMVDCVKSELSAKRKHFATAAFSCVGMVAKSMTPLLKPHCDSVVACMCDMGLEMTLIDALGDITEHIPSSLESVQDRLLELISSILSPAVRGAPSDASPAISPHGFSNNNTKSSSKSSSYFNPSTKGFSFAPAPIKSVSHRSPTGGGGNASPFLSGYQGGGAGEPYSSPSHVYSTLWSSRRKTDTKLELIDLPVAMLALHTLGSFDFEQQTSRVILLAQHCVLLHLEDDREDLRLKAAVCVADILARLSDHINDPWTKQVTMILLKRLVMAGVSDETPHIRLQILRRLIEVAPRIYTYLSQTMIVQTLAIALNDEEQDVREIAIRLMGTLSDHNPAAVFPSLRKTLLQQLSGLRDFDGESVNQEGTSKALGYLIESCPQLIKSYVTPILNVLVPRLAYVSHTSRGRNHRIRLHPLKNIGQLATICGEDMTAHLDQLLPLIIDSLQDKTVQVAALRTLAQLVANTGNVVHPCLEYPTLLSSVLEVLKQESSTELRIEILRVLGTLGALDPLKYQANRKPSSSSSLKSDKDMDVSDGSNKTKEADFFPTVALTALMKILNDPSLSQHHGMAITASMFIFRSLGVRYVPFLPQIVPSFLNQMATCDDSLKESFLQHIWGIVNISQSHIAPFLDRIISLCLFHWDRRNLLIHILELIEECSLAVKKDMTQHLPSIIPKLLRELNSDTTPSPDDNLLIRVMTTVEVLAREGNFQRYLNVILPALLRICETEESRMEVRSTALLTVVQVARSHDVSEHASRLVQPVCRVLAGPFPVLHRQSLDLLCILVRQLGFSYLTLEPVVHKILCSRQKALLEDADAAKILQTYKRMMKKLKDAVDQGKVVGISMLNTINNVAVKRPDGPSEEWEVVPGEEMRAYQTLLACDQGISIDLDDADDDDDQLTVGPVARARTSSWSAEVPNSKKLHMSQKNLTKAWAASRRSTKDDWIVWMRGLSLEVLKESPSSSLRACSGLAHKYPPLARELFNAAFMSCWTELHDQYKDNLISSLEECFKSKNIPPEIVQTLLNLAEFMEHHCKRLPVSTRTLGSLAMRCNAYAQALYYKEIEFETSPSTCLQSLISINNKLSQTDAAEGILQVAHMYHPGELKESWYEKLNRWSDALEVYERKQMDDITNVECTLGRIRCLSALGEWPRLLTLSDNIWSQNTDNHVLCQVAPFAVDAACNLRQWERMDKYLDCLDTGDADIYKSIAAIHRNDFHSAHEHIQRAFVRLDSNLRAQVDESYRRAYSSFVQVQQLVELEEVIKFKISGEQHRRVLLKLWDERLENCKQNVAVWQPLLSTRSLVVPPTQNIDHWLRFSALCRKSGQTHLSLKVLTNLMGFNPFQLVSHSDQAPLPSSYPQITYACLKHLHSTGYQSEALSRMQELVKHPSMDSEATRTDGMAARQIMELQARQHRKIGLWSQELMESESGENAHLSRFCFSLAF